MDLNKLRTFTVVAECENITKAAEKLYRTQPAISNQLKDLEEELQLALFERKNSRIYLTAEGQQLYVKAKTAIQELDDLVLRIRNQKHSVEGLIRIAVEHDTISYLLPQIIQQFKDEFPRVRFEIVPADYGVIDNLLLNNEVDFALMVMYTKREFFRTHPIFTFSRSLVASPNYLQNKPEIKSVEDLLNLNLIAYHSELGDMRFWLKKNGWSSHIPQFEKHASSVVVHDAYTLNELLFAGVGVGFSFDNMAGQRAFQKQKLKTLFPESEPIYVTVDLAYKRIRNESYLNQQFREFVLNNANQWSF